MGTCAFGEHCYKQHVLPDVAVVHIQPGYAIQPREEASVPICEYFHRGKCTYGDSCNKSHDALPLYKKDLKKELLRSAATVAAGKKSAVVVGRRPQAASSKVQTELVRIVKNRTVRPATSMSPVQMGKSTGSSTKPRLATDEVRFRMKRNTWTPKQQTLKTKIKKKGFYWDICL